jgi:hypothetical protein
VRTLFVHNPARALAVRGG